MTISQLTSRNNPLLKTIRRVSSGARRAPDNLVVAEGIRVLEEVQRCGCEVMAAVISEEFGHSGREKDLLDFWISRNVRISRADSKLFLSISEVQAPQGALALVNTATLDLADAPASQNALILSACGIQDPGNLGTLIRTSAAAGVTMVCTSKGTVSARNSKAIRASAGAFFRMPVIEHVEISDFLRYAEQHRVRLYRTDVREGLAHTEADLGSPCAILLGNEGSGISSGVLEDIPALHIPMAEGIESLNVATAGAIILFEAARQRIGRRRTP
jgi:RNA methyltransferase, TrmH family